MLELSAGFWKNATFTEALTFIELVKTQVIRQAFNLALTKFATLVLYNPAVLAVQETGIPVEEFQDDPYML